MSTLQEPLLQTSNTSVFVDLKPHLQKGDHVKLEKSYFEVMGLCCVSEVALVERILKPLNGVKEILVVVPTKTVIVFHDICSISPSLIAQALNQARLGASYRPRGEENHLKKWPGIMDIACGMLLMLSFLKYVYQPMQWLAIGVVLIGAPNIILKSIASIRNLTLNINCIVLLAVVGTLALLDFSDAAIIVFLYNIAQWLESRASYEAISVMSSLTSMTPQKATLSETGEQVDVMNVKLSSIIAVKAGEVIPIDGVVVDGKCEVDEKALTGESFPVTKEIGSTVWAGTINLNGYISIKTTTLAENSLVARMVNLVEEAQSRKSRIETFINNCAKWYIPVIMMMSLGVAVIPTILHIGDEMRWFRLALVVLVSACPCALIISTPVTTFCALSNAATTGLLFKGGDYLELLAKVKAVAFDKTGTITRGDFVVTHFQSLQETISEEKLLFWVSSIESKSSHPMAAALVNYAVMHSTEPLPEKVEDFHNYPGEGIYGKIDSEHIYIGNYRISQRAGCKESFNQESHKMEGKSSGFIYMGQTLVGIFSLSDECRIGAMEAIKELKTLGIRTVMLTGDNHGAAQQVQNKLEQELDEVHAELLPEDKAQIIEDLKKEGAVAMVGDGINDALALATADIGISMGISGSALAMETGHVILMSNDIRRIPQAIRISKRASRKIIENVAVSLSTKGVVLALAIAGYSVLGAAVMTDVGTCLLVIFNSMLLLRGSVKHETVPSKTCGDATCKSKTTCQSNVSVRKEVAPSGIESVCRGVQSSKGCCGPKTPKTEGSRSRSECCDTKSTKFGRSCDENEKAQECRSECCDTKSTKFGRSSDENQKAKQCGSECCGTKSTKFGRSCDENEKAQECKSECCDTKSTKFGRSSDENRKAKHCGSECCDAKSTKIGQSSDENEKEQECRSVCCDAKSTKFGQSSDDNEKARQCGSESRDANSTKIGRFCDENKKARQCTSECCDAELGESSEKNYTISCGKKEEIVDICSRFSCCTGGRCRISAGCCDVGGTTSLAIVIH